MFSSLRGWEWLIIVALVLLLFGAKRLPDAARGLGRSLRIFKSETKGLVNEGSSETAAVETQAVEPPAPPAQVGNQAQIANSAPVSNPAAGQATAGAQPGEVRQPAAERTES